MTRCYWESHMFSKILQFSLLSVLIMSGCGNYLGGKDTSQDIQEVKSNELTCLKDFSDNIRLFLESELNDEKVNLTFSCIFKAVDLFQKKTIGSGGDSYKTKELKDFFEQYFFKDVNLSEELATELMKFKKAVVAGEDNILTKNEINKLVLILDVLKSEAIHLGRIMTILTFKKGNVSLTELDEAESIIKEIVQKLLNRTELSESEYSFQDAKNLISELINYYRLKKGAEKFESIQKWIPLFEAGRKLIIGENETLYGKEEFLVVSRNLIESYFLSQYFFYHIKSKKIDNPKDLNEIMIFVEKALDVVSKFHQMRSQNQFSFLTIDHVVDTLDSYNYLPNGISSAAIKEIIKVLTARNFDPSRLGDMRGLQAFERKHLQAFSNELSAWMNFQFWINSIFTDQLSKVNKESLLSKLDQLDLKLFLQGRNHYDDIQMSLNETYFKEMKKIFSKSDPIILLDSGKYFFSRNKKLEWSWKSLSQLNVMMLVTRGLMNGYSSKRSVEFSELRLTASDLESWYKEFNKLGFDLKAFDQRSKFPGNRSFYEANLFTASSNGDDSIDPSEAFDFLTLLISGGMFNTNQLFKLAKKGNCELRETDFFSNFWIDENCFIRILSQNLELVYDHMPNFNYQLKKMSADEFKTYISDTLKAIRVSPHDGGRLETADLRTLTMVIHYVESLMYIYDVNRDQFLDQQELRHAAPRFHNVFKNIAKVDNSFVLKEAFINVVLTGKIPNFNTVEGSVKQVLNGYRLRNSDKKASRKNLIQVFKLFKSL